MLYLDRDALWLSDVSGRKRWEVVGGPAADAAFTADGTHILYQPATTAGLPDAIFRINLHGGARRRLVGPDYRPVGTSATSFGALGLAASILQDGRIALERAGRLFSLDPGRDTITSLGAVRLPALPAANSPPSSWTAVAPHGTRVALFAASGQLMIRDVRTGHLLRRVVPAGGQFVPGAGLLPITGVSWSPNDPILVYELGGPGGALKAVDMGTGREWTLLRVHLETLSGFTWSPDGSMLAFSDVETGTNVGLVSEIELINAGGAGLRTLDPQATRPGWVQAHVPGQTGPMWSPSARSIGYTRISGPMNGTRPFQTNVWLADLSAPA